MTADKIITAVRLIQDMEGDKKARDVIKVYDIESLTEVCDTSTDTSVNIICVQVHETSWISASFFYFVNTESKIVYNASRRVVFQGKPIGSRNLEPADQIHRSDEP